MEQNFIFSDPAPYPPVQVCGVNQSYARAMLANIGSGNSEMSSLSLYFYNSIITRQIQEEVSECFHKISIVEMRHLDIFGELARLLGADPRLWYNTGRRAVYWSPCHNKYPKELPFLLKNSIHGEMQAIEQYRRQANWIEDENITAIINRIILDEEHHVTVLRTLYQEQCI